MPTHGCSAMIATCADVMPVRRRRHGYDTGAGRAPRFVAACFDQQCPMGRAVDSAGDWLRLRGSRLEEGVWPQNSGDRGSVIPTVPSLARYRAERPRSRDPPRTRLAEHASLPRRLTIDEISRLLDAARTGKAPYRDRAILLLAVQLGLRSAEIIAMELDDIDWRAPVSFASAFASRAARGRCRLPRDVGDGACRPVTIQLERPSGLGRGLFIGVNNPAPAASVISTPRSRAWSSVS